jgi:hypothetical protein
LSVHTLKEKEAKRKEKRRGEERRADFTPGYTNCLDK